MLAASLVPAASLAQRQLQPTAPHSTRLLAPESIAPPAYSHECSCETAPPREGSFLFYNRVPKCGSTTMLNFVEEAARRNGFASASSHVRRRRRICARTLPLLPTTAPVTHPAAEAARFHWPMS